jgi:phosphatidylinositol-3-phosphatase
MTTVAVLLGTGLVAAHGLGGGPGNGTGGPPGGPGACGGPGPGDRQGGGCSPFPTPIQHVFLIVMENEQTNIIYGQQPFETALANEFAWGGDANTPEGVGYYATCHPSAPNYLALTAGQPLQCGSDGYSTYSANNLGNLLDTAGESWVAWEESATVPCQTTTTALYAVKHNPFPYFSDLGVDTPGSACETHVLPIANLTQDYPYSATPPAFTYIVPNLLNDGHNTNASVGDGFLASFVPKLMAERWFQSSVIFITWDEGYNANGSENFTGYDGLNGGPVYTVAVSPYTAGVGALGFNSTHYDVLSTIEWLLGLPGTGTGNDSTPAFPALPALFNDRLIHPGVDFAYTNLPGANLSGRLLQGDELQYANLEGANLAGANLGGADLQYANLRGADLVHADLAGANLQYADLAGAVLSGAFLAGANLDFANLSGATLTGLGPATFQQTNFDGANLGYALLAGAICGTPNDITAFGADINAVEVPSACAPPL